MFDFRRSKPVGQDAPESASAAFAKSAPPQAPEDFPHQASAVEQPAKGPQEWPELSGGGAGAGTEWPELNSSSASGATGSGLDLKMQLGLKSPAELQKQLLAHQQYLEEQAKRLQQEEQELLQRERERQQKAQQELSQTIPSQQMFLPQQALQAGAAAAAEMWGQKKEQALSPEAPPPWSDSWPKKTAWGGPWGKPGGGGVDTSAGKPLGERIDDWVMKEATRKERETKKLEEFLRSNAKYLDAKALMSFQALSARGRKRVIAECSLKDAWDASALIRAWGKDALEDVNKKRKTSWGDDKLWLSELPDPDGKQPMLFYISIATDNVLVQKGMPPAAACMDYDREVNLFEVAHDILQECLGAVDVEEAIVVEDDPDWTNFPDIGKAVTAGLGGVEKCYSVAIAPGLCRWAVGVSTGLKGRLAASKLALASSIAFESIEIATRLCRLFPDFAKMWKQMCTGTALDPEAVQAVVDYTPQVHLIQLEGTSQLVKDGMPSHGYAIMYNKNLKDMFSYSSQILQMMVDAFAVDFIDDYDCTTMPDISRVLVQAGIGDDAYTVATCKAKRLWAVGLGASTKTRKNAAKLALALGVGQADHRIVEASEHYEEFCKLALLLNLITPEQAEAATQRRVLREGMYGQH